MRLVDSRLQNVHCGLQSVNVRLWNLWTVGTAVCGLNERTINIYEGLNEVFAIPLHGERSSLVCFC